jgi:NitT/TauT family transport system ATP-binding protein
MARALAQDSQVLLMDEPFAALDAITRDALHDELVRLWTSRADRAVRHAQRARGRAAGAAGAAVLAAGRVAKQYVVGFDHPRRIESPEVAGLSVRDHGDLRDEIRRHGARA